MGTMYTLSCGPASCICPQCRKLMRIYRVPSLRALDLTECYFRCDGCEYASKQLTEIGADLLCDIRQKLNLNTGALERFDREALQIKSQATSLVRDLNALPDEEKSELQQLENNKRKVQLERYLERHLIKGAKIRKIGSARKAVLASFGIETAADIERHRVAAVQRFGPSLVSELLAWRRGIEQDFALNAREPISTAQIAAVKTGINNKTVALETSQRSSLSASANAAFTTFNQRLSDERRTHSIFMRVAKIVSVSCLGIILLNPASTQKPSANLTYVLASEPTPAAPLEPPRAAQAPFIRQQASMNSAPVQAPTPQPAAPPYQRPNDATRQSETLATVSANGAPTSPGIPTFRNLVLKPTIERKSLVSQRRWAKRV
jgi:hypothetical protein